MRRARIAVWLPGLMVIAAAAFLNRAQAGAGAGVSWTGNSVLTNQQSSDGSEHLSNTSDQTSSDGQELHDRQTLDRNPDGSTHETQDLDWLDGKGDRMENHTTWDRDKDGNRSRRIEDSQTDPEGNKTTKVTEETFDRSGNRTSKNESTRREKVEPPPKREEEKKEEPREPEKPQKPPQRPSSGNKPQPAARPAENVQVTLSLHASPACQPGVDAVSVSASGTLPLDVTPIGFTIMGNLTIQDLTTKNFSCQRSYYEYATNRMVGGECQVQIQKENPSVFVGLTAIEPLGLGYQMPGVQNQQDLRGSVRAGGSSIFDVIRGSRYDTHTARLELLFGQSPPMMQMTPIPSLMRADLSDGFNKTFAFQGQNFVTVADAGNDRPQPFSGTCACGELKTNGQLTLNYKSGGRGPAAQPPATGQSGEGTQILGMSLVTVKPNRPGGVPGVLVTGVDPKRYAVGPGTVAKGDVIVMAGQQPVTCVEDFWRIAHAAAGQNLSIMVMRGGSPMIFTVSQK